MSFLKISLLIGNVAGYRFQIQNISLRTLKELFPIALQKYADILILFLSA
jgi:hypothetical protein